MNKADNQNSTYRRIIMVSKTSDDLSLSHTKWNCKYHNSEVQKKSNLWKVKSKYRSNIEAAM